MKSGQKKSKKFSEMVADKIISDSGFIDSVKSTVSEKLAASIAEIKESVDPLNLANIIGGRATGAVVGSLSNRSQEDMEYFLGTASSPSSDVYKNEELTDASDPDLSTPEKILGNIYTLIKKNREDEVSNREEEDDKREEKKDKEDVWHKELIDALSYGATPQEKSAEVKKATKPKKQKVEKSVKPAPAKKAPKPSKYGRTRRAKSSTRSRRSTKSTGNISGALGAVAGAGFLTYSASRSKPSTTTPNAPATTGVATPNAPATTGVEPKIEKISITGDDKSVMEMIKKHEGYRNRPYKDSLGLWTVGVGHLIEDGRSLPPEWNRTFSNDEVDQLLAVDYKKHKDAAVKIPGYENLNKFGQAGLIDLTFNMGPAWYKKWPNFVKDLQDSDTESAAKELERSKWYTQVGRRAPEVVALIRNGKKENENEPVPDTGTQMASASSDTVKPISSAPVGEKISSVSQTNKDLKDSMKKDQPNLIVNNTSIAKNQTTSQIVPDISQSNDNPPYLRKAYG